MNFETLKNNNKYPVKKLAAMIANKEIQYQEIFDFIKEDYESQFNQLAEKTDFLSDKYLQKFIDYSQEEIEKKRSMLNEMTAISNQAWDIRRLELDTIDSLHQLLFKKFGIDINLIKKSEMLK